MKDHIKIKKGLRGEAKVCPAELKQIFKRSQKFKEKEVQNNAEGW